MNFQRSSVLAMLVCMVMFTRAEDKPSGTDVEAVKGEPRFFDELFEDVSKIVNQGQSVVKQVQTVQGVNGATKIIKTEVTQTFGPGYRFKRDLFSNMDGILDAMENKVSDVKDRVAGKVADAVNIGFGVRNRIKERLGASSV